MLTALVLLIFFALHQDIWLWRESRPLVFGVLPVGLAYHAAYTLAVSVVMAGPQKVADKQKTLASRRGSLR